MYKVKLYFSSKRKKQIKKQQTKNVDEDYRLYNVFIAFINAPRNKVTLQI